tara:strand:- start:637 stop:798 length:162 start_codon:yes stop_codon:yes gene_type:complete
VEAYTLVKQLKFDYTSVQHMSSLDRKHFLQLYGKEMELRKESMESMKNNRYRR